MKLPRLFKSISGSLILKLIGLVSSFLISVLLARTLGPEKFGVYSYVFAIITILTIPTNNGFPNMIVRYTSMYSIKSKHALLKGLYSFSNTTSLLISLSLMFIAVLINAFTSNNLYMYIGFSMIPILALCAVRSAILNGLERVIFSQIPDKIINPTVFILLYSIYYIISDSDEISLAMTFSLKLLALIISFIFGTIFLFKLLPKKLINLKSEFEKKKWIKTAIPMLLVGGMMFLNNRLDLLLIGLLKSMYEVGVYQVVTRGAEVIVFGLSALNIVFSPKFSKYFTLNDSVSLQNAFTTSARIIFCISFPIATLFIFWGEDILVSIYGSDYAGGGTAIAILSVGQLINSMFGAVGQLLIMTGYEKLNAKVIGFALLCNLILNVLLIPHLGINGAALATSLSMIIWNFILAYLVYKKLNVYPTIFKGKSFRN
ncbi:flippase [Gracilibacillus kekensis]|uniref:Membrane protein involved in the export of O-antigen and teichoic acid n=1 Tax=Gracilibacillus kekensis TaxID=1027249 RepID=A0A1M7K1W8_9BACI|nr:flippase [Gracilibacillus kekensis]SHM59280.1 Membrane protein involved in the export of O-antigen and teichoic acid [Gracilibacillus kekensis]